MFTLEQVDDTKMVKGLVFHHKASHLAGGPTHIENAKIGLIHFQMSPPKTDIEQSVIVSDYTQVSHHQASFIILLRYSSKVKNSKLDILRK
jgi:chaperonin GroEL (HSP60 family)